MRRPARGMTLTELLTVVSVITILVSMMSPVLIRTLNEARRRRCMANISQISTGLQLIANDHFGKLPRCYDVKKIKNEKYQPKEGTWWYRKVAKVMYPTQRYKNTNYDHLNVPRRRNLSWWNTAGGAGFSVQPFDPERTILRCPSCTDMHDEGHQAQIKPRASGIDKDRVFDDNYGYSNYGFKYMDANYGKNCTIYYKHGGVFFEFSRLYHKRNKNGKGAYASSHRIHGRYTEAKHSEYDPDYAYIGALADYPDPAGTILLMDYVKADIAPNYDVRPSITVNGEKRHYPDGARFRHGGRANVLFLDGHVDGFRDKMFRTAIASGTTIHWAVKRRP